MHRNHKMIIDTLEVVKARGHEQTDPVGDILAHGEGVGTKWTQSVLGFYVHSMILFLYTFTSEELGITQAKIIFKSYQEKGTLFCSQAGYFLEDLWANSAGEYTELHFFLGISWLGFLDISSQLSVLFCTRALLQINFQAGEIPRQIILWWNNWIVQGPIGPTESSAHVQTIAHGKVRQN